MNALLEKIEKQLNEGLTEFENLKPLERYNQSTALINRAVIELNNYLQDYEFGSQEEEILFFKQIRPTILSNKIKISLYYNIDINEPIGTNEVVMQYLEECLKGFQSLFKLNAFYYQYYKNQFTELDHLYFIRKSDHSMIPVPEITDPDNQYSTPMSDLFAKFIAYEQAHYHILKKVSAIMNGNDRPAQIEGDLDLRWTGEVVNAVELAYGIWLTGQINNGNASLNQIIRWLEVNLKVNIGIAQRRFTEISRRKRLSITKFLDQMKNAILGKVESDNS